MRTGEYPKTFARFYDLIYHQMRDSVDSAFFLSEAQKVKGRVLEVGAGTGRLLTDSLNSGVDIYGIDISEPMLDILRTKIDVEHLYRISNQDIIDFSFGFQFDLIVAPFRVLMHIVDKDDQMAALNNVHRHLKPNGRFIFDTFVPSLNQLINGINNQVDFDGEYEKGCRVKRTVSTKPDLINQLINITFRIDWNEGDENKSELWNVPLRYFFRYELEHLVERSDFKEYKIFGDYQRNPLSSSSKEFVVECFK